MKKVRVLALLCILVFASVGILAACNNVGDDSKEIDYGITPLKDLEDYQKDIAYYAPAAYVYNAETKIYNNENAEAQKDALNKRIADQKKNFDNRKNMADGWETIEQSTFEKIFSHATGDGVLEAFAYAAIPNEVMKGLVEYATAEGNENFFDQYRHLQDYDNTMAKYPNESSAEYQNAYKDQQRLRRKMLNKLDSVGLKGDAAGRLILQLSEYGKTVAEEMRLTYASDKTKNFDDYFKLLEFKQGNWNGGLFDYDTLVFFKTNDSVRGAVTDHRGAGDKEAVRAYGFMYQYQMAGNKALNDEDFEKELVFRFKKSLSDTEAVEFAKIKRINYAQGYRYSDKFYKDTFYPAVNRLEAAQESVEATVYGINSSWSGKEYFELAGNGVTSEPSIKIKLGSEFTSETSASLALKGVQIGTASDLLAGDMEYYYMAAEKDSYSNAKSMAAKQRDYENSNKKSASSYAPAQLKLQLENLKMTYFVIDQFISRNNMPGLSKSLQGQIYAVAADDIATLNQFKKDLVVMIAELDAYQAESIEYYDAVAAIGRKNAQMNSFVVAAKEVVSNVQIRLTYASTGAQWQKIHDEIDAAIKADYSQYEVSANGTTPQLNYMRALLVKQTFTENGQTKLYIEGVQTPTNPNTPIEYDANHGISQMFVNERQVLYHSAGIIEVGFKKAVSEENEGITFQDWKTIEIQSGETLKTGANYSDSMTNYPIQNDQINLIRGSLSSAYEFKGWALDQNGFYPIDYDEEIVYDATTYYPVFKKA